MQPRATTLAALAMRPVAEALARNGEHCVIGPQVWSDPRRRVPTRTSDALWLAAEQRLGPEIALEVAEAVVPSSYGHLTYLLAAAPTVGVALRQLVSRYTLLGDGTAHHLDLRGKRVRLVVELRDRPRPAVVETFAVAVVAAFVRRRTAGRVRARRVALTQSQPGRALADACRRRLAGEIEHGASWTGFELDRGDLDLRFDSADPGLFRLLEAHAELLAAGDEEASIRTRVADAIAARGPVAGLRAADVAADLGMSERTMRRRLAGATTSYQAVLDAALGAAAERLLAHARVEDVAAALDYADAAAFRRAYRRWTGAPPRAMSSAIGVRRVEHELDVGDVGVDDRELQAREQPVTRADGVGRVAGVG
jgi:AraC-like DNA-binding protein